MRRFFFLALVTSGTLLTACGGGGGGSSAVKPPAPVPFTSFSAVTNSRPVQASGISQTASVTTFGGLGPFTVLSTVVNPVDTASTTAQMTYGILPAMTAFSFSTPQSNVSFSGTGVQCSLGTGVCGGATTGNNVAAVINPLDAPTPALAWNYQTFGYWLVISSSTNAVGGAISFGNPTPVASVPVSGTATYNGLSSGSYVDQSGAVFVHAAQMTSIVDFGAARSVTFSTTNTTLSPLNVASPTAFPQLNLTGTFAITANSNQFSGTVTAPGGGSTPAMTGNARGQFYGPTAQEIGGVFSLKGTGPQTMLGGFGGKQP